MRNLGSRARTGQTRRDLDVCDRDMDDLLVVPILDPTDHKVRAAARFDGPFLSCLKAARGIIGQCGSAYNTGENDRGECN
jgi:hypothetical protein